MHYVGVVQAHRTSANLHEPQHHRDSNVCRGLSHAFGVIRLYQTFSLYSVTGETRSAGCFCNSSGWFKHSEPQRTYSNHNITELARCVEVSHEFGVVRLYRTFSSYILAGETRCAGCLCTSSGWFRANHPELVQKHPAHLVSPALL